MLKISFGLNTCSSSHTSTNECISHVGLDHIGQENINQLMKIELSSSYFFIKVDLTACGLYLARDNEKTNLKSHWGYISVAINSFRDVGSFVIW